MKSLRFYLIGIIFASLILSSCSAPTSFSTSQSESFSTSETSSVEPTSSASTTSSEPTSSSSSSSSTSIIPPQPEKPEYIIFDNIPSIYIDTPSGFDWATKPTRLDKWDYVKASITVSCIEDKYSLEELPAKVKVRGNYTSDYDKKPFKIKFDEKVNLLGLNEEQEYKEWVLLADWKDRSMMRNLLTAYLARLMYQEEYYCTDFTPVEVFINDEYWGVYLLVEQQEVKSGRVDITKVKDDYEDIDIGYFFEYDGYYYEESEDPTFVIPCLNKEKILTYLGEEISFRHKGYTIKSDIYSTQQIDFIKDKVEQTFSVLYYATYQNKAYIIENDELVLTNEITPREAIERVIDVQSFLYMYILEELACDIDISWSSLYLSYDNGKSGDKLLKMIAPWDFDSTYGLVGGYNVEANRDYAGISANYWLTMLNCNEWFRILVGETWANFRKENIIKKAVDMIEEYSSTYDHEYKKEYERWSSSYWSGEMQEFLRKPPYYNNHLKQIEHLVWYLNKRSSWLDKEYVWMENKSGESFKATHNKIRYEAEDALLGGTASADGRHGYNSSNDGYVGLLSGSENSYVSFFIDVDKEKEAYLVLGISKREIVFTTRDLFYVTHNNFSIRLPYVVVGSSESSFHDFSPFDGGFINLTEGINVITFYSWNQSTNFDYIDIYL